MTEERLLVTERIDHWDVPDDLSVNEIIVSLGNLRDKHADHSNLRLEVPHRYEFYIEDGFSVMATRPETDEEYEKRLAKALLSQEKKLARAAAKRVKDEAEFERLRKKLGK